VNNQMTAMITLQDVSDASVRIAGLVRETPLMRADPVKVSVAHGAELYLKLENLQISGSFKARGAMNKLRSLTPAQLEHGLVAASGGNHGLGVAYAGWLNRVPVTIYLGHNTPQIKADKLKEWGATVVFEGDVFDDANRAAIARADHDGLNYVHPFNDPLVIAGQGTVGLEIFRQAPTMDTLIIAVGGGGLISGIATVAKALNPAIRIIGVEPTGAPTYYEARKAGHVIELPAITTVVNTLAPRMGAAINFAHIAQDVAELVLVTDDEMREAARWLWHEMNIAAELAGSAAMAALLTGRVAVQPGEKVCVLVCGAGTDGIDQ
jgi:threonine dehydratase